MALPNAFEKVVDRLLSSEACAERLAMDWMDLARYADSHGMHADGSRRMWPWRDWVIKAFHQNMPYDDFVTWQLAGDLLPNPSKEQYLATAFNRNHPMTAEGGVIDEEFRLNYVFDRSETYATAFLGLTMNCAKCHDHKFDPFSQEEYYELASFFNNIKEVGMTGDDGNYGPMLLLTSKEQDQKIQALRQSIAEKEKALQLTVDQLGEKVRYIKSLPQNYQPSGRITHLPMDKIIEGRSPNGQKAFWVDGNKDCTARSKVEFYPGKQGMAVKLTGNYDEIYLADLPVFEVFDPSSVGLWINSTKRQVGKTQTLIGNAGNKNNFWRGWDFYLDTLNRLNFRLIHALPHNYLHVRTEDSIATDQWFHVAYTYDGSGKAEGVDLYINGQAIPTITEFDRLYKNIHPVGSGAHQKSNRSLRIGKSYRAFTGENGIFQGLLDELNIYNRALLPFEVQILAGLEGDMSTKALQQLKIQENKSFKKAQKVLKIAQKEWLDYMDPLREIMVMQEMKTPRTMYVLNRGEYDAPTVPVAMNTPAQVLEFESNYPKNRLGLAQWTFDPKNPLTARVTVNRYWQMLFGQGIVKTPQDFGVQGALPSHPELLDWLALYFQKSGWNVKALLKKMVTSAVYQQASEVTSERRALDPENIWLARGPSYRLPAEMIRDNALAASGLLVKQVGGPSVRPYQPEGLWIEKGNFSHDLLRYKVTKGDSLYRRSLYTFVKRTSPHPAMVAFDAPNRDVCTIKRENTNTPLQSLVLLNDPQFVEAAKVLAERVMKSGQPDWKGKINFAFRLVTSRSLAPEELEVFHSIFEKQKKVFAEKPDKARDLLKVGDYVIDPTLNLPETAAMAMVASTMFNHDEAYIKR